MASCGPVNASGGQKIDAQIKGGDHRQIGQGHGQRAGKAGDAAHRPLAVKQAVGIVGKRRHVAAIGLKDLQLRQPLDAIDDPGTQVGRDVDHLAAEWRAETPGKHGHADAGQDKKDQHGKGNHRGDQRCRRQQQHAQDQRHHRWRQHPDVKIVECVDVGGDAVEQIAAAIAAEPGRGQRDRAFKEPHTQS